MQHEGCVVPLRDAADPAWAGAKAATLARLARAGFPVPDGLVLTVPAFDALREHAALGARPTPAEVCAAPLPPVVVAALESVAAHFADVPVAVRSSAVAEDLPDASYAGQYDTVLGVVGLTALREAVRRCWASAFAARVHEYAADRAADHAADHASGSRPIAVLVQEQVEADVAGIAFTADPVTGARGAVLVSAAPGVGDAVARGAVAPDEWSVAGGTATPVRVAHQALTETQARVVAELALRVAETLGSPQDIEWAMAGGRLVLLQARPITALPTPPEVDLPPGTWVKEADRHPEPLTVLGAALVGPVVSHGLTMMSASCGGLIERFDAQDVGGEPYLRITPVGGHAGPPPPWWVLAVLSRVVPPLRRRMRVASRLLRSGELDRLHDRWTGEWRPDLQQRSNRLHAVDLPTLSDEQLATHLDEVIAATHYAMDIHFRLIPPYLIPVHTLVTIGRELLGWSDTDVLQLLAGASPTTSEPTRALTELANRVRTNPAALAALDEPGADLGTRLSAADTHLGAEFERWCARYGQRNVHNDPGSPTLAELPWMLASLLRDAVSGRAELAAAAGAAQIELAREKLRDRPGAERERFESALTAAVRSYPLREDSAFWTGSVFGGAVRRTAIEIGRRLVARGALTRADDAVQLAPETLRLALLDQLPDGADPRADVRRAVAERAWTRAHPGPPFRGAPPPDVRGLPAAGRQVNEALLWMQRRVAPADSRSDGGLTGVPAAPGRVTGPVRIITDVDDFARLRPGEVLVCRTTDPAWTVLFGVAAALITDGGGVLSHAAIVAREYAIPAVVGTGAATSTLADGQVVTVDGTAGSITIDGRLGGRGGSLS